MNRGCSIDADLGDDPFAHRFEAPCVPKEGRATATHALPVLRHGGSEALPFAVFSRRACLPKIGRAAHASRRAYPPRVRTFASRASATRHVARLFRGLRYVREAVTQVRTGTRLCRGARR